MTDNRQIFNLLLSDLATTAPLPEIGSDVFIEVPDSYLSDERFELAGIEGLAIQRLITLAHNAASLKIIWHTTAAKRLLDSPSVHPLAAVILCLNNVEHVLPKDANHTPDAFERARAKLLGHRLSADMFADRQALICLDYERPSLPTDLYQPSTRVLRPEEDWS